jgi:anti-sigma B factor antagonist
MEPLRIELVPGDPPVLRIGGEIDIATEDQLRSALEEATSGNARLVVDMADVTFIGASGLRVIVNVAESLNGVGPLTLVNAERVAWFLKTIGLDELSSIEIIDTGARRAS